LFDVRQRFIQTALYELRVGPANTLLGDWQLNMILTKGTLSIECA
jgi:hypothetical protein